MVVAACAACALACSSKKAQPVAAGAGPPTIREALAAGDIDDKTAAYLGLVEALAPERLPSGYAVRATSEVSAEWGLIAAANLDAYPPDQQAAVRALLSPPTSPEFVAYADPNRKGCWAGLDVTKVPVVDAIETEHFTIIPLQPATRSRVMAELDKPVPSTGAVPSQALRSYLDAVFDYYAKTIQMPDPTARSMFPAIASTGGGTRIPIYVGACPRDTFGSEANPDGFIMIDVVSGFEDPRTRRFLLPHEIFHLFEFAAIGLTKSGRDLRANNLWPIEAAAVYVEDVVAGDVHRWSGATCGSSGATGKAWFQPLDRAFRCPEEPFHIASDGACRNAPRDTDSVAAGNYSKFVWFKFLARQPGYGPTMLRYFFDEYAKYGLDPQRMFTENQMAHLLAPFEIALLAVRDEVTPTFAPEDRNLFYRANDDYSLDYDFFSPKRYTFWVEGERYAATKGQRLVPAANDIWSRQPARFATGQWRIEPHATHRWLIEIPPEAYGIEDPSATLAIAIRAPKGAKVDYMLAPLDGTPGRPENHLGVSRSYMYGQSLPESIVIPAGDLANMNFLLGVLVNLDSAPIEYEVAVSLPDRCRHECRDHYKEWIADNGCCEDHTRSYRQAINEHNLTAAMRQCTELIVPQQVRVMCDTWCKPRSGFAEPYLKRGPAGDCTNDGYVEALCKGIDCDKTWAGFVPISEWPQMSCTGVCLPPHKGP